MENFSFIAITKKELCLIEVIGWPKSSSPQPAWNRVKNRYQNNLESMKDCEFTFTYVHLLYCKCYKINLNRGESYIDSPDCIKNKKATLNPINKKDNKCFQYALTFTLNQEEIGKYRERITKSKPFVNKHK